VEVVKKLVTSGEASDVNGATKEDVAHAVVAAQVADTAEKLDSNDGKPSAV